VPKQDFCPKHQAELDQIGQSNWCDIVTASKFLPDYELKLADDSSSDDGDDDGNKTENETNDDNYLGMESNADSGTDK